MPEVLQSSAIIASIIENDLSSTHIMSQITQRFARETLAKDELDRSDVTVANQTTSEAFKRSQLLSGKPTDRTDIVDVASLPQEQRTAYLSKFLSNQQ
jgi:hypothetical protein